MQTNPSSGQTSRFAPGIGPKTSETPSESSPHRLEPEEGGRESLSDLRGDIATLKDTLARLVSQASGEAVKTVRNVSQTVASQVGGAASGVADAGSDLASSAKEHAKTFASELEGMTRRNPLGTLAGALLVGVVIGMISRGRS